MFEDLGTLGLSDVLTFARSKGWLEQAELALEDMPFDLAAVKKVGGLDGILHWPVRIRQQWLDDGKVVRELADKVEDPLK